MNNQDSYCVMCKNPESLCNCVDSVRAFAQAHVTSHDGKALIDGDTLTVLILRALEWAADRSRGPSRETLHDALVLIDSWIKRGDLDPNDNGTAKNSERNGMVIAYNLVHALWRGDEIEYGPHRDEYSPPATSQLGEKNVD